MSAENFTKATRVPGGFMVNGRYLSQQWNDYSSADLRRIGERNKAAGRVYHAVDCFAVADLLDAEKAATR